MEIETKSVNDQWNFSVGYYLKSIIIAHPVGESCSFSGYGREGNSIINSDGSSDMYFDFRNKKYSSFFRMAYFGTNLSVSCSSEDTYSSYELDIGGYDLSFGIFQDFTDNKRHSMELSCGISRGHFSEKYSKPNNESDEDIPTKVVNRSIISGNFVSFGYRYTYDNGLGVGTNLSYKFLDGESYFISQGFVMEAFYRI